MKHDPHHCFLCGADTTKPGACASCQRRAASRWRPSGFAVLDAARMRASVVQLSEAFWLAYLADGRPASDYNEAFGRWWMVCEICAANVEHHRC